jgi:type I restriction enzyme S subunit
VKLGEVCTQDRQIVEPSSDDARSLTYISLEHIESETGRIANRPIAQVEDEGRSTTFRFDQRHVLYGKLRPYLNKVALPSTPGRCTTEMIPLLPCASIEREFLAWLLRRTETVHSAMQNKTGSRMPRADMNHLLNVAVPLPPLEEQRRIAAVLREQMAAVDNARAAAEAELNTINALPAALLQRAFAGGL